MLKVFSIFILSIISVFLDCYAFSKLNEKKLKIKLNVLFYFLLYSCIDCFIIPNFNPVIKVLIINLFVFLIFKMIFKVTYSKALLGTFLTYLALVLSEVIFAFLFLLALNIDKSFFVNTRFGFIISNLLIDIIYFFLFRIRKVVRIGNSLLKWYENSNISNIFNTFVAIVCSVILLYQFYIMRLDKNTLLVIASSLIIFIIFIFGYFSEKMNNDNLNNKYINLLEYSDAFEDQLSYRIKKQHEYKNQLILINDMVNNKKVNSYINDLLENDFCEKDDWINMVQLIPFNGLKGLIYYKIKKMKFENIIVYIDVNVKNKYKNVDIFLQDISKIVGVFLDNAIESAVESEDKQIIIELFDDDNVLVFRISNSYLNIDNCNLFSISGYSTKGKNRGHGLSLVNDIITNNNALKNEIEINGKFFVQKLYIKK